MQVWLRERVIYLLTELDLDLTEFVCSPGGGGGWVFFTLVGWVFLSGRGVNISVSGRRAEKWSSRMKFGCVRSQIGLGDHDVEG